MKNCKRCGGWRTLGDDILADTLRSATVAPDICDRCLFEAEQAAEVNRQAALEKQTIIDYLEELKQMYKKPQ